MADSYVRHTGDGSTTDFNVPFPYLDRAHVGVKVDGVTKSISWVNDTTVRLSSAPSSGAVVEVRRTTPTSPLVDFLDGAVLFESDLDRDTLQSIYLAEESKDLADDAMNKDADDKWDAESKPIKNVGDPTNPQDVATKNWSETAVESSVQQAETAASNAATSESNAATSEANAATSESNAADSEDKAEQWAEEAEDVEVETGKYSAKHHASKAATSASDAATSESNAAASESAAATSESNAATSASDAATSETNAATSESNAAASESAAATSESNAATSETNAAASETKAEQWAEEAEDTPVESGKFSAKHWAAKAEDAAEFHVTAFGAVGDGTTDDTAALNTAAAAAGPMVINPGTYRVTGTVTIPAGKVVRGAGGVIFADPDTSYPGAFEVAGDGVEIQGVHFRGNGVSTGVDNHGGAPGGAAIKGDQVEGTRITGCTFEDFVIDGADIQAGPLALTNCRGVIVSGNHWLPSNSGGVDASFPYSCGDCQIIGNYSRSGADALTYVAAVGSSDTIDADSDIAKTSHHVISGNVHLKWDGKGANTGGRHGIIVHYNGGISHAIITNNILVGANRHGIYLRGDSTVGGDAGPDLVAGNIIRYCGGGEGSGSYYGVNSGIHAECTLPSVIEGNLIEYAGYFPDGTKRANSAAGIGFVRALRDTRISGNAISKGSGAGIMVAPTVSVTEGSYNVERVEIVGNNVQNNETIGIYVGDRSSGTYRWVNIRDNTVVIGANENIGIGVHMSDANLVHVDGNTVVGTGTTGDQTGIAYSGVGGSGTDVLRIIGNRLESLDRGCMPRAISASGGDDGSTYTGHRVVGTEIIISENDFVDCGHAVQANNTAARRLNMISPTNRFRGSTSKPHRSLDNWNQVILGEVIGYDSSDNPLVELHINNTPTAEQWYQGDRVKQLDPAAGGKIGVVCTASGDPGTWKDYGVIDS